MSQFKIDTVSTQHVENPETSRGGNRRRIPESKSEGTAAGATSTTTVPTTAPESRTEQVSNSINQKGTIGNPLPVEVEISGSGGNEKTSRTPSTEGENSPTGYEELTAIHAGQLMNINKQKLVAEEQRQRKVAAKQVVEAERQTAAQTASDRAANQDDIIAERVESDLIRAKGEREEKIAEKGEVPQMSGAANEEGESEVVEVRDQRAQAANERRDQAEARELHRQEMIAATDQSRRSAELARKSDASSPEQRRDEKVNVIGSELFRHFNTHYELQSSSRRGLSPAEDRRALADDPPFGVMPSEQDRKPIDYSSLNTPPESIPLERQTQAPETAATQQKPTRPAEEGSAAAQEEARRAVKRLQEEGVFGHSPFGLPRTVSQFIYQKEREYGLERREFTADDFLRETEQAIYETLKGEHATTVTRTLIETAEAVNSIRNLMIRAVESTIPSTPNSVATHSEPRQPNHEPER